MTSTSPIPQAELALRPVRPSDEPFLQRLYASTREAELASLRWDENQKEVFLRSQFDAQRRWYLTAYPAAEHSLVLSNGAPIGRLLIERGGDTIRLVDISLLPDHCGRGLGTRLLERLIDEAKQNQRSLQLQVLWSNQGAVRLYKRLGFEVSGGDQLYCQMKRRPPAEPTPPWAISLRPVTAGDESLLLELYASTRADELVMAPWTSKQKEEFIRMQFEAQRQHYEKEFPNAKHQLVCLNGAPCGRVYVARTDQDLHILDITIAPEKRNAGIGSMVLQALIFENVKTGGQVTIWVEDFNPSLRLFRRLGFQPSERQGFRLLLKRA